MGKRPLNLPFLGLQALLILIDCIAVAYVSPILVSFGYSPMRIGRVMTLAALAATLARPVWGYLNDHFACARQVTLLATAAGISCYCLLIFGGDAPPSSNGSCRYGAECDHCVHDELCGRLGAAAYQRGVCAQLRRHPRRWVAVLCAGGYGLWLGSRRWGFRPGSVILWVLFILLAIVILHLPNPGARVSFLRRLFYSTSSRCRRLSRKPAYRLMLLAFFLCTLASCAIDSFHSVLILALGGTERHVGAALLCRRSANCL